MMEIFGLIDRSSLPLGVPYLPGNTSVLGSGFGGLSGFGGYPGMGSDAGCVAAVPIWHGWRPRHGGVCPAWAACPVWGQFPGMSAWPGAGWGIPNGYGQPTGVNTTGQLDGIWELDKGGFVVIRGSNARLYLSREKFQDFRVGYDRQNLWWAPDDRRDTFTLPLPAQRRQDDPARQRGQLPAVAPPALSTPHLRQTGQIGKIDSHDPSPPASHAPRSHPEQSSQQ